MIVKIKKIENLAIYKDFTWNSGLNEFKKYNVIYGPNGSGKSTFSNLLRSLEKGHFDDCPIQKRFSL